MVLNPGFKPPHGSNTNGDDPSAVARLYENPDGLKKFFDFHLETSIKTDAETRKAHEELAELDTKIEKLERELDSDESCNNTKEKRYFRLYDTRVRTKRTYFRIVAITVECADPTDAEFELTYQVHRAGWSPSYDVRIQVADTAKPTMKVHYFGSIHQSSGEHWNDVQLTLSTAEPRRGGSLPRIGTLTAALRKPKQRIVMYDGMSACDDMYETMGSDPQYRRAPKGFPKDPTYLCLSRSASDRATERCAASYAVSKQLHSKSLSPISDDGITTTRSLDDVHHSAKENRSKRQVGPQGNVAHQPIQFFEANIRFIGHHRGPRVRTASAL